MSDQFLLPGLEPPPKLTDRLFFAVMPDQHAIARITQLTRLLSRDHGLHGKPIDLIRLHVTLLFLGDYAGLPKDLLTVANQVATATESPAFTARFDRAVSFAGRERHRPLVLLGEEQTHNKGEVGLLSLHRAILAAAQKSRCLLTRLPAFKPHVTLLYDAVAVPETAIEPIEWQVREFVLLRSHIGRGGSYEVLGRWPLRQ